HARSAASLSVWIVMAGPTGPRDGGFPLVCKRQRFMRLSWDPQPGIFAMRRPILVATALAAALTASWGCLERAARTDAGDRAADRVVGYAERPSLSAQTQGLAVAARERAPSDFPPIRPSDATSAMIIRTGQ